MSCKYRGLCHTTPSSAPFPAYLADLWSSSELAQKLHLLYTVSLIAQLVKIRLQCRRPRFDSSDRKVCWRRNWLPSPVSLSFSGGLAGKESAYNAGDLGLIPGLGRPLGEGKSYPLQDSSLENSKDCMSMGVQRVRHGWVTFTFTWNFSRLDQTNRKKAASTCLSL